MNVRGHRLLGWLPELGHSRWPRPTAIALGAVLGMTWGVLARLWMRLISDSPEFSWSGTPYIVLVPTMMGAALGLAAARRSARPGGSVLPTRITAGALTVLLGAGAGMLVLPTIFLGGLAISRYRYAWPMRVLTAAGVLATPVLTGMVAGADVVALAGSALTFAVIVVLVAGWRTRAVLAGLALLPVLFVMYGILFDTGLPWWRLALGAAAYPALLAPVVWSMRLVFAPMASEASSEANVEAHRPLGAAAL